MAKKNRNYDPSVPNDGTELVENQNDEPTDENAEEGADDEFVAEGGARVLGEPVGSVAYGEDGQNFGFDDLLPQVQIHHSHGVSMSINQSVQNGKSGNLYVRLISDFQARVYVYREDKDGITTFRASVGHNVS